MGRLFTWPNTAHPLGQRLREVAFYSRPLYWRRPHLVNLVNLVNLVLAT